MKLRQSARILKGKALSSVRASVIAFNGLDEDGRLTEVLLRMQHAFEMLMKAALNQQKVTVFDTKSGRSISLDHALRKAQGDSTIRLTDAEVGLIRTIDALRNEEQHWYTTVDEGILYVHLRAGVTLFDDLLERVFGERLGNHIPRRVLPIGAEPPRDFQLLVDNEFERIKDLLKPGRHTQAQVKARIRALLALEAHTDPDTEVSERDVARVQRGITQGKSREQVFPKLATVGAEVSGQGIEVQVRFVKKGGMPVTFVADGAGASVDAAAVRVVDLQKKYYLSAKQLAEKLGVTTSRSVALRRHVGADDSDDLSHTFNFESQKITRYSDNAFTAMRDARDKLDMDALWRSHGPVKRKGAIPPCSQPGCATVPPVQAKAA